MIRPFRKYDISQIGYYLSILTESGNNVNRAVTLINGVNDSRYAGCSFVSEDWFEYVAGLGKNKELYLDNGHLLMCQNYNSRLDDNIMKRYGYRYMLPSDYEIFNEHLGNEDLLVMLNSLYAQYLIELFEEYNESFKRIYDVILQEYEPLYNLDVTYEETHSGTDSTVSEGSHTDTTTYSGSEKDEHKGTDTITKSGSEANASTGHDDFADQSGAHTETVNTTYAFDSANGVPESKSRTENGRSERTTYGRTDTTTFNNRQDATAFNSSNTKTFTNREDETVNVHGDTSSITHGEKIKTRRYGNQGVTRSDELANAEITFRDKLSFLNMVSDRVALKISIL